MTTDTLTSFVSEDGILISDETLSEILPTLDMLGEGISRKVYALSDSEVLKVGFNSGNWFGDNSTEAKLWFSLDESDRKHFAEVYAHSPSYKWIIAERAYCTLENCECSSHQKDYEDSLDATIDVGQDHNVSDLHYGNVGHRADGSYLLIDYAANGLSSSQSSDGSQSHECSCFECQHGKGYVGHEDSNGDLVSLSCECRYCREFADCECETWEGCRRQTCSVCECENAGTVRDIAKDRPFFLARKRHVQQSAVLARPVCKDCVVDLQAQGKQADKIKVTRDWDQERLIF